jgi:hypothetical protein
MIGSNGIPHKTVGQPLKFLVFPRKASKVFPDKEPLVKIFLVPPG